ncbi:MAG: tryptophan synthase subunit alpha [Muribaculaceae bacterium]|nr:tryptophan synthase subunit alpha [Muribaculaceae bacterium]
MNRLNKLFENKDKNILSIFFTAGYPTLESTVPIIEALEKGGIDLVEIGIPFSDPMADGPVIQASSSKSLNNGMTLKKLLSQVSEAREKVKEMPFVLMGYLNPVMKYGVEKFFKDAQHAGVDALIIPDLPFDDYMAEYKELSRKYDIPVIMLITLETSEERIHLIDDNCDGFIYMVSSASTTGAKDRYSEEQLEYFHRINEMPLKHLRLIGFGISNPSTFSQACFNSSGAIIGSHFIKCLDRNGGEPEKAVKDLLKSIGKTH